MRGSTAKSDTFLSAWVKHVLLVLITDHWDAVEYNVWKANLEQINEVDILEIYLFSRETISRIIICSDRHPF
jgi:hypothetical protein